MNKAITIDPADNLAVALTDLTAGEQVSVGRAGITLREDIRAKHKFALRDLAPGDEMYMYGLVVGTARRVIQKGTAITVHNTAHKASMFTARNTGKISWAPPDVGRFGPRTFNGYHRKDGQVGTANYWLVMPLVFCQNHNVLTMKKAFEKALGYEKASPYETLAETLVAQYKTGPDGAGVQQGARAAGSPVFTNVKIKFITHEAGCGGTRQDSDTLCRLLAGYLKNPNVAGATVFSLGCQNAEVEILQKAIQSIDGQFDKPLLIFDQQETGARSALLEQAIKATFKGMVEADKLRRQPAPLSKLTIGLECGASDGFSGISANPALGYVSDLVTALGGKVILAEFPELCGVEQELLDRIACTAHADKFIGLMRAYAERAREAGSGFDMNPSPGNIKDGLITDAMKSAGAARKGGSSPVTDVLDYTEYVSRAGLSLLCTPGNDVESTTGLVGSGANVVLFTTGLGTPTGNPIAPVLKVSSNNRLAEKMTDIIDLNAGGIITGTKTIAETGEEILDYVIRVASGELQAKAEILGQDDFIPWKRGISL